MSASNFAVNASNVANVSMADLIAFYNAHSGKQVKKFSDRKSAEKRVNAIFASMSAPVHHVPEGFSSIFHPATAPVVKAQHAAFIFPKAADFIQATTAVALVGWDKVDTSTEDNADAEEHEESTEEHEESEEEEAARIA